METPLCKLEAGRVRVAVSPDNRHVAILVRQSGKDCVVLDGVPGKTHEWIVPASLAFTGDSAHCVYVVQQGKGMLAVIDGKEGQTYSEILNSAVLTSLAGARTAYVGKPDGGAGYFTVIDGQETGPFEQVGFVHLSDDGKHVALALQKEGRDFVQIDGVAGKSFEHVIAGSFHWNSDGSRHVYAVASAGKQSMVIDGVEGPAYASVGPAVFSADGKRVAYVAERSMLVLDGREQKRYDKIATESIRFSREGGRVAYLASTLEKSGGEKLYFIVDGQPKGPFEGVVRSSFIFSPDGRHTACIVMRDRRQVAVVDGVEGKPYDDVRLLQFGADTARAVYLARQGAQVRAVIGGVEGPAYPGISHMVLSPDGKHLAYIAGRDKNALVVLDEVEGPSYGGILPPTMTFSPRGSHLAYEAYRDAGPMIVVDGAESPEHEGSLKGSRLVFDDEDSLRALVIRKDQAVQMRIDLK